MAVLDRNISADVLFYDDVEWVRKSYADDLAEKLKAKQRSKASHNHQFAEIADLWSNLPMHHAGAPYAASAEAFRKHGLIKTGFCDVDTLVFETHEKACASAPFVANLARKAHGYALTVARGPLVICHTPHSQSFKAMGKEQFHASKQAVLDWAYALLEIAE